MDAYNFTYAEKLFIKTEHYNWDNGNYRLYETLKNPHCDKATALMIYWRADPDFYYSRYLSEADVPEGWELDGYKLMKEAENRLLANNLPETIAYTPDKDRIPKDNAVLKKIPPQLLLPTKGVDSSLLIKNYIEAEYLIAACSRRGSLEAVKEQLESNPGILNLCIGDRNPLIQAVSDWENKNSVPLITFLLEKGADVNVKPLGYPQVSLLFKCVFCKNAEIIKLLVQYGADINAVNYNGDTLLHKQFGISSELWKRYSNQKFIKALLAMGADLHKKNSDGKTPVALAKEHNIEPALKVIAQFLK